MQTIIIAVLLAFIGGMVVQRLLPARKAPQVIYLRAETVKRPPEQSHMAGCLPFLLLGLALLALPWLVG
jgi:hypothetical protein